MINECINKREDEDVKDEDVKDEVVKDEVA